MKYIILFIVAILSCLTGFAQGGYDPENPGDPNPYRKLTVLASPKVGGYVNSSNGPQVGVGQTVTCYADENRYYQFVHWLKNGEIASTKSTYEFIMPDENVEMTAVFELNYNPENPEDPQEAKPSHRVTLTASPGKGGSFNNSVFKLCEGDSTNVYAYPNEGYRFEEWLLDGVLVSTKNPLKVKMTDRDLDYTARFSYNPINPSDPAVNLFNAGTGEMVIDRFEQGYLSSAVSRLLGDDYEYSDIQSLLVSGIMDGSDFGIMYRLINCSVIDLSRTNGYSEIPSYAFESTEVLTELILPSCINTIDRYAFQDCKNLSVLTCYAVIPPTLSYGVFDGVDKSVVIKVPAQSIDLYRNATGWKDFTILPADADVYSIAVSLPSDAKDGRYKNMNIELMNILNGQRYKYLITDKTEYVFGNLLSSTKYSVSVKNAQNEVLGELTDLEVVDKDIKVSFQNLLQPRNISVKVLTPEGQDITNEVTIKWFNESNELLQQGSVISGVLENSVVSYTISLPQQLQNIYIQPTSQTLKVSDSNSYICTLEAIGKCVLSGKIRDKGSKPISTAIITISQNTNGTYSNSVNAHCDGEGKYTIEVPDVPVKITISANGYISQTKELQSASTGVGDIVLEKNTGITIFPSYTFQASVANGETSSETDLYSDDANIAYRIEDENNNEIPNCIYQAGSIILPESIELGDNVFITAYSKNNKFKDVSQAVFLTSKSAYVSLPIVEYGGINVVGNETENSSNICLLYDNSGKQVRKANLQNNGISFTNLPDGRYSLITMNKSSLLGSVQNLSSLKETPLKEGIDYLVNQINVHSGQISEIAIANVPSLDETKLYFTNNRETYFMSNKQQLTIGNYLTLKAKITMKDEYSDDVDAATLIVDIPANCDFVDNSVISGAGYLGYEYSDNRLSIPIQRLSDAVRFCIIPLEGGECKLSAFIKLIVDNKEILQPIGSAYFEAKNFSLIAPKKSSKPNIAIRGTATSDSEVLIYDNETLVGSTYSMPNGQWSLNLSLHKPYSKSIHYLYGEVITPEGKRLLTQSRTVDYDQGYVDLSKVTMVYNNTNIVFDHLNGKNTANSYSYAPGTTDFTFIADFTENNPEKISNVIIEILASDGSVRSLPADYNATSGNWVVRTKYADSNKLPVNVTAIFDLNAKTSIYNSDREKDDEIYFNQVTSQLLNSFIEGNITGLVDQNDHQIISIIPKGEIESEHIGMERLDYNQLKKEFQEYISYHLKDKNHNIEFRDSLVDNNYVFYWIDNNINEAFALKYYGNKSLNISGQQRILPILIASIVGGAIGSGIDRYKHQGIIDFWKRQLENDKNRIQKNHTDLINALYAECEDGTLKIKDSFKFQIDEEFVDRWADNSIVFLAKYKRLVDYLEQFYNTKFFAQNLLNIGVSLITEGLSAFIPPVSQITGICIDGAIAEISAIGGNVIDSHVKTPEEAISKWFDIESKKLTDQYIEVFGYIKSDYSDCKDDEDEEDDNDGDEFPAPPVTPSIDPSGYVYEAVPSNRIPGVTATAYFKQQTEDMYGDITETSVVWDAAPFGQENPLSTDTQGMYAWDVPAGMWQVRFEKEGYEPAQSAWLPVPPPQLDVNIAMTQAKQPEVKTVHAYSDGVTIEFDKFMLPSTLTLGNITVTQNGMIVNGSIEAVNIELDVDGNAFCSKVEFKPTESLAEGEAMLFVSKSVKSYANLNMNEDFSQSFTIEPRISEIKISDKFDVNSGSSLRVNATILPATAAKGKAILLKSLNELIATVSTDKCIADTYGNISFDVTGIIIGHTDVKLSIEGYDIDALVKINVTSPREENQVTTPYASVESGEVAVGTEIYLYCETENASIYYTLDGSCPCDVNRQQYDGTPIVLTTDLTLKIMAEAEGMIESDIAEYHYSVISSGIGDIQIDKDLNIYPLPLGEYLNISNGDYSINEVSIYDLNGKRMVHSNKSEKQVSLRVGFLPSGLYILNVETNGKSIVKKVIKH